MRSSNAAATKPPCTCPIGPSYAREYTAWPWVPSSPTVHCTGGASGLLRPLMPLRSSSEPCAPGWDPSPPVASRLGCAPSDSTSVCTASAAASTAPASAPSASRCATTSTRPFTSRTRRCLRARRLGLGRVEADVGAAGVRRQAHRRRLRVERGPRRQAARAGHAPELVRAARRAPRRSSRRRRPRPVRAAPPPRRRPRSGRASVGPRRRCEPCAPASRSPVSTPPGQMACSRTPRAASCGATLRTKPTIGVLRRRVHRVVLVGAEAGERRGGDDRAAARLGHQRGERPHAEEHAVEVHRSGRGPAARRARPGTAAARPR